MQCTVRVYACAHACAWGPTAAQPVCVCTPPPLSNFREGGEVSLPQARAPPPRAHTLPLTARGVGGGAAQGRAGGGGAACAPGAGGARPLPQTHTGSIVRQRLPAAPHTWYRPSPPPSSAMRGIVPPIASLPAPGTVLAPTRSGDGPAFQSSPPTPSSGNGTVPEEESVPSHGTNNILKETGLRPRAPLPPFPRPRGKHRPYLPPFIVVPPPQLT